MKAVPALANKHPFAVRIERRVCVCDSQGNAGRSLVLEVRLEASPEIAARLTALVCVSVWCLWCR